MNDSLLGLYHSLPSSFQQSVATARGLYLRWWRYGPQTEQLVAEALARDRWEPDRWEKWQEERLAFVLHRAATSVPYYRQQWTERRRQGDRASYEYLENWPVLEKEVVRKQPDAFLTDSSRHWRMTSAHTSGTTGKPLKIWWTRENMRKVYALMEARCRRWNNVSIHERWATVGGQLVTDVGRRQPPFWVWNGALNQLYMSSYHLAPDLIRHYLEALRRYRITHLYAYTSSLYALAQEAVHLGVELKMKVVCTNAEPLFDYQRRVLEEAFQCNVRETYGMAEAVAAASECSAKGLHIWPEVGWIEVLSGDQPVVPGLTGDIVGTAFLKTEMPLIRYRNGDRGALKPNHLTCSCGRALPLLDRIEGRIDDLLYTTDGRRIGRLDPIFKGDLPIREAQIIQDELDQIRVRCVPASGFNTASERKIIQQVRARMGEVEVTIEQVNEVPRETNGKFRAVVCNLDPEKVMLLQRSRTENR